MEKKIKHLEFIQNTINRMANNSFLLKGWSITVSGGLFALILKNINYLYLIFALLVTIIFWFLDGYYLSHERLFIKLYEKVSLDSEDEVSFSMNISTHKKPCDWLRAIFSKTTFIFYGSLLLIQLFTTYAFLSKQL